LYGLWVDNLFLYVIDRWGGRWSEERDTTIRNLCSGNSDVHSTEKQQKVEGLCKLTRLQFYLEENIIK